MSIKLLIFDDMDVYLEYYITEVPLFRQVTPANASL